MTKQTKIFILVVLSCTMLFLLAIPSFAADEPSEGGQSSAPIDLTGTTWYVPTGWSCTSNYGYFEFTGTFTNDNVSFEDVRAIRIGYAYISAPSPRPNSIMVFHGVGESVSTRYELSSSSSFTISFTGGSDVNNPNLISWLMSNGTWTNPPEPEPTPTYTIPVGSYLINETTDMPPLLSPYTYTGRFSYDGKIYTNLVFNRQGIFFIDESGDYLGIYQRANVDNPWSGYRNFTLLSNIVTEDEELYNYFINNTQPYEPDVFDVLVYFIDGFFKALDKFVIFYNFSLLDFIYVTCGLLASIWFLKVLAGG